jgi:hypothetical protein
MRSIRRQEWPSFRSHAARAMTQVKPAFQRQSAMACRGAAANPGPAAGLTCVSATSPWSLDTAPPFRKVPGASHARIVSASRSCA